MNLAAWWKWNLDDVDTKFPKNSIPNWFLTQIYHHTTNGNHPYPGVLALVVYFQFGWEKNHETTFPKSLPAFRLPVVMALTVGTRVAGILIPKRTCCDLFHLCWIAWLFSYFEVCLVCTTCQSQKHTILEVNIIYVLWFICSSRRSSRVLSFLQFEEAEAWVRSCREVVVQSLESTIEECLAVTLRVDDFTESLRSWGVSRHILICTA